MKNQEKISKAALHIDDRMPPVNQPDNIESGFCLFGNSHADCFKEQIKVKKLNKGPEQKGFLTTHFRFVDRYKGWDIAEAADQISYPVIEKGVLHSQDLPHLREGK